MITVSPWDGDRGGTGVPGFFIPLLWRHNGSDGVSISSLTIVYSTVYSGADQRKHQSSASLAFVRGIHRALPSKMASNAENVGWCWCDTDWSLHDEVIKWKHFPRYWTSVRGIHRSPVNSPNKGQWRGAMVFSLICGCTNDWVNNREAGDLKRHRTHYDVTAMVLIRQIRHMSSLE